MRNHNVNCKIEVTDADKQKTDVCMYVNGYYVLMIEKILQRLDISNEEKVEIIDEIIKKILSK